MNFDFEVTRRPPAVLPPGFTCAICVRKIEPPPYAYRYQEKPPICTSCTNHWGAGYGWNAKGGTRGDQKTMRRLSAVTTALKWEAMNGRRAH
jgi:hypothetical protein